MAPVFGSRAAISRFELSAKAFDGVIAKVGSNLLYQMWSLSEQFARASHHEVTTKCYECHSSVCLEDGLKAASAQVGFGRPQRKKQLSDRNKPALFG